MALLRSRQPEIKLPQLWVGRVDPEQAQALVAAGLDNGCHQQGIQQMLRLGAAQVLVQTTGIGRSRQGLDGDPQPLQVAMHPLKMLQLLPRQRREGFHQTPISRVAKEQTEGVARCFFLTIGVV
jgi:hypothetical protein